MQLERLKDIALQVREDVMNANGLARDSFSAVDMLVALYFADAIRVTPEWPENPVQDRLVVSRAHAAHAVSSVLCRRGFFSDRLLAPEWETDTPRSGALRVGHVHGLDAAGDANGRALALANGLALGLTMKKLDCRVYCLMTGREAADRDAVSAAAAEAVVQRLSGLCVLVDDSHAPGAPRRASVAAVWQDFGWRVIAVDGHDLYALRDAYRDAATATGVPTVIVADTLVERGKTAVINHTSWHSGSANVESLALALDEVRKGEVCA